LIILPAEESMHWIDIILPEPGIHQDHDLLVTEAIYLLSDLPDIQEKQGLDSRAVMDVMREVGQKLFQSLLVQNDQAFNPEKASNRTSVPVLGSAEHDNLQGYHVVTSEQNIGLPWQWLHNGVEFLLEKHPICTSVLPSALPDADEARPWMQRQMRAQFMVGDNGDESLKAILNQLRPGKTAEPELLFVAGHTDEQIRRLMFREAEIISGSLERCQLGETLAEIHIPTKSLTPSELNTQGLAYQAIHFAGPTSVPVRMDDANGEFWMNQLIGDSIAAEESELEEIAGAELDMVGIDPITALLDGVSEKYDREGLKNDSVNLANILADESGSSSSTSHYGGSGSAGSDANPWILDDGPVGPETMSLGGGIPPLVFSNSHRALPELGYRFTNAGASTFVGPVVPLFSRPARIFSGHFYAALGNGWCAGAAVWEAARQCSQELGKDHPAWLSYGVQGYGSLALQYL
jgi:hypothetical protein